MSTKLKSFLLKFLCLTLILGSFWTMPNTCFAHDTQNTPNASASQSIQTIPIAMASDENYVCPTIVSMTSVMKNSDPKVKYEFYIMHPPALGKKSKKIFKSFENKYKNCTITLIDMGDSFNSVRAHGWATPTYYRLMLPELLPNIDKIIWLDSDTIVFENLIDMMDIDMKGYCYRGFLDYAYVAKELKVFGVPKDHYICAGVMLISLKELRECNAVKRAKQFMAKNHSKLFHVDQTVINAEFVDKIGILPAKFGIFNRLKSHTLKDWVKSRKHLHDYGYEEMSQALSKPAILHCTAKPWKSLQVPSTGIWWSYAEQSGFLNKIKEQYSTLDGVYVIVSALDSNKVLDVPKASTKKGEKLHLWKRHNGTAQRFVIKYDKNGCYTIKAVCSGKFIDVPHSTKESGKTLWQYDGNFTDAQKWYIFRDQDGTCRIVSKCNNMAINVKNSCIKNGTPIQCCRQNGTKAQKFRLVKVG